MSRRQGLTKDFHGFLFLQQTLFGKFRYWVPQNHGTDSIIIIYVVVQWFAQGKKQPMKKCTHVNCIGCPVRVRRGNREKWSPCLVTKTTVAAVSSDTVEPASRPHQRNKTTPEFKTTYLTTKRYTTLLYCSKIKTISDLSTLISTGFL